MQNVHVFILKLVINELSVFKGYCFFTKWFCTSEDRNTNFKCSALPNLSFIHTETNLNLHRGTSHVTARTQALVRNLFFSGQLYMSQVSRPLLDYPDIRSPSGRQVTARWTTSQLRQQDIPETQFLQQNNSIFAQALRLAGSQHISAAQHLWA